MDCQEIIPGFLYLGSSRASKDMKGLQALKITHIINIAGKQHFLGHFEYFRSHFDDSVDADMKPHLQAIFSVLESVKQGRQLLTALIVTEGKRALVHCSGGVSRSPSVVIAYLIMHYNQTYEEAFNLVKRVRPGIKPNKGFVTQLIDLDSNKAR